MSEGRHYFCTAYTATACGILSLGSRKYSGNKVLKSLGKHLFPLSFKCAVLILTIFDSGTKADFVVYVAMQLLIEQA